MFSEILNTINSLSLENHIQCASNLGCFFIGIFGIVMASRAKRSPKFKFKISAVFLLPIICSLGEIHPSLQPSYIYFRIYMATFIILLSLLYWREIGHLSASIREHKEAFAGLINSIPDMVWLKEPEGRYTYTNTEATDSLILCDPKEILGKTDDQITYNHRKQGLKFIVPELFESGKWVNDKGEIVQSHINDLVLRVYRIPIYVIDNKTNKKRLWGVIGFAQNMTGIINEASPLITRKLDNGKTIPYK